MRDIPFFASLPTQNIKIKANDERIRGRSPGRIQKKIPAASWATSTGGGVLLWPNATAREAKRNNGAQKSFHSCGLQENLGICQAGVSSTFGGYFP